MLDATANPAPAGRRPSERPALSEWRRALLRNVDRAACRSARPRCATASRSRRCPGGLAAAEAAWCSKSPAAPASMRFFRRALSRDSSGSRATSIPTRWRRLPPGARRPGLANLRAPLAIDAASPDWPIERADAVLSINMVHISPWAAALGLIAGAARLLAAGRAADPLRPVARGGSRARAEQSRVRCRPARPRPGLGPAHGGSLRRGGRGGLLPGRAARHAGQQSDAALWPAGLSETLLCSR